MGQSVSDCIQLGTLCLQFYPSMSPTSPLDAGGGKDDFSVLVEEPMPINALSRAVVPFAHRHRFLACGDGSLMTVLETANRIREWRTRRRLSLAELGETVGLSRSEISKLESGSRRVRADHLVALAKALKVPPEELMDKDTVRDMLGELPPPQPSSGPTLPVLQSRRQDGTILVPRQEPTALSVPAPPQLVHVPGAYAFYMPDTSFEPRVPVGALLFANTVLPPRAGDLAVIALERGEPVLVWVERRADSLVGFAGKEQSAIDLSAPTVRRTHRIAGLWFP